MATDFRERCSTVGKPSLVSACMVAGGKAQTSTEIRQQTAQLEAFLASPKGKVTMFLGDTWYWAKPRLPWILGGAAVVGVAAFVLLRRK